LSSLKVSQASGSLSSVQASNISQLNKSVSFASAIISFFSKINFSFSCFWSCVKLEFSNLLNFSVTCFAFSCKLFFFVQISLSAFFHQNSASLFKSALYNFFSLSYLEFRFFSDLISRIKSEFCSSKVLLFFSIILFKTISRLVLRLLYLFSEFHSGFFSGIFI
jgi:hypothetical protein